MITSQTYNKAVCAWEKRTLCSYTTDQMTWIQFVKLSTISARISGRLERSLRRARLLSRRSSLRSARISFFFDFKSILGVFWYCFWSRVAEDITGVKRVTTSIFYTIAVSRTFFRILSRQRAQQSTQMFIYQLLLSFGWQWFIDFSQPIEIISQLKQGEAKNYFVDEEADVTFDMVVVSG